MLREKETKIEFNKIDIDVNAEPVIVKASKGEVLRNLNPKKDRPIEEDLHTIGKQLAMKNVIGIDSDKNINKRQKILNVTITTIFIVFVLSVLVVTAYNDFFGGKELPPFWTVIDTLKKNWYYFLCALVALFFCFFLKGLKLSIMCKARTGKFMFGVCFKTGIIGHYYNNVTPLAVGGQPFEIYYLSKHGVKGGEASALPVASFFLHQLAFVLLGLTALILYNNSVLPTKEFISLPTGLNVMAGVGLATCFFMPLLVITFCFLPKIGAGIVKFIVFLGAKFKFIKEPEKQKIKFTKSILQNSRSLKKLAKNPLVLVTTILVSFAENLALSSICYFTLRFFGFDIVDMGGFMEWIMLVQICILLYSAISFIPTPGNSGAADLSFYVVFATALAKTSSAFVAMLTWRSLSFYSFIIVGFIFTSVGRRIKRKQMKLNATKID